MPAESTVALLRKEITDTFACLDGWCDRSPEIADIVPDDVGWSVKHILEHVGLVNKYLLLTLRKGVNLAVRRATRQAVPDWESDLSIFADIADPDAFDWRPPEHMIPTGMVSVAEAREILAAQREECYRLLDSIAHGEGLLHTVRMSVRDLGRLDMYQWLWFLLMHARRHLTQMERACGISGLHLDHR